MRFHQLAILSLFALASTAAAVDLSKIERKIVKEPAYRSKPRYCLLVLGPEAKMRVWLVQDGDTLYVDRNGNGDLTEPGEKVAAKKEGAADGLFTYEAGNIHDGKLTHRRLILATEKLDSLAEREEQVKEYLSRYPGACGYTLAVDVAMPARKGGGIGGRVEQYVNSRDVHGVLRFSDTPGEAPVIHFGGPLQVTLDLPQRLTIGREMDLTTTVGTPGLGAGTLAAVLYEGLIPKKVHPAVTITYPPRAVSQAPLEEHYQLKERC